MVIRLLYGNPIEDEVNRLTDEGVPNHELEIASALNFADKVRSKEFSAKDVARVLRKRLEHNNPVVQILALNLIDICIKNGGSLIQLEISRREFIDQIVGLMESKTGRYYELTQLILKLIQEWAHLFKNNTEMGYPCGVYERMKRSGYSFPRLDMVSSGAMMETASPPEWEDSPVCQRCRTQFTFTNRKHHCRHCGKCFCNDCSSNTTTIPKFGLYDPVRVCHGCYLRLKKIVSEPENAPSSVGQVGFGSQSGAYRSNSVSISRPTTTVPDINEEDEDLKRAIELSIQESQKRPNYADFTLKPIASQGQATTNHASTFTPKPSSSVAAAPSSSVAAPALYTSANVYPTVTPNEPYPLHSASATGAQDDDEENDPELLAAIEASLQDMPGNGVPDYALPSANNYHHTSSVANNAYGSQNMYPAVVDHGQDPPSTAFMPAPSFVEKEEDGPLTTTEKENVQLFESLLTRMRDGGQDIRFDPQIQYLHECIGKLHPRITEAIEGIDEKNKEFGKLHDRIVTAIKIYDQLLDKRLRPSSYMAPAAASANTPSYLPPQQQQPQPGYAPSSSAQSVVQYQTPAADHMYGQGSISTPYNAQNPEQQAQVVPQPNAQTPQYMAQPQQQHQQQQIPQQHSFTAMSAPPSSQAVYPASPGYVPSVATPQQHNGQPQQLQHPAYLPAQPPSNVDAASLYQQSTPGPKSPSINPYYAAPPAVAHVPSIPVLQPTSTNAQSPAPIVATPAAPVVVSAPEPEEAPLIEF